MALIGGRGARALLGGAWTTRTYRPTKVLWSFLMAACQQCPPAKLSQMCRITVKTTRFKGGRLYFLSAVTSCCLTWMVLHVGAREGALPSMTDTSRTWHRAAGPTRTRHHIPTGTNRNTVLLRHSWERLRSGRGR